MPVTGDRSLQSYIGQTSEIIGGNAGELLQRDESAIRLRIGWVLLGNPKFIIMDEPTSGLVQKKRGWYHNMLSKKGENIIVILSTQIIEDISELCRKIVIFH